MSFTVEWELLLMILTLTGEAHGLSDVILSVILVD